MRRRLTLSLTVSAAAYLWIFESDRIQRKNSFFSDKKSQFNVPTPSKFPNRQDMLQKLKNEEFDLLVIGGGATGAGCALDAATRGVKVAMVERDDFSSGTSSRSTKLVHGGVRYLEKAFLKLDRSQFDLVVEALHERGYFLNMAPYLAYELPIMLPIYQSYMKLYYWIGAKAYDLFAWSHGLSSSYYLSKREALQRFPTLQDSKLQGAIVYYDGAQNDSRMNVALAVSAGLNGAAIGNHVQVEELVKSNGKIVGAVVCDTLTNEKWTIKCKGVINATGPFTDSIRKMDDPSTKSIVQPSSGVHLVLPKHFCPKNMGLIDPATSDGRVVFFLPWENTVIAGTTDAPTTVSFDPKPTEQEIDWIINALNVHMNDQVSISRKDVLAAWTGIRPLVQDPNAANTEALVRNHIVHVSDSGLVTIAGGKWTTFRAMAKEAVDTACVEFGISSNPCVTENIKLVGSRDYTPNYYITLLQKHSLDTEVAEHLSKSYGTRAEKVLAFSKYNKRLSSKYPILESEIIYGIENELSATAVDALARRTRLAFIDAKECLKVAPRVVDIMGDHLNWSKEKRQLELAQTENFLDTMSVNL